MFLLLYVLNLLLFSLIRIEIGEKIKAFVRTNLLPPPEWTYFKKDLFFVSLLRKQRGLFNEPVLDSDTN